jgi:hypothetical protein
MWAMPRYFFDMHDGGPVLVDEEGQELDGLQAAQREALSGLADLARDVVLKAERESMGVSVRDEAGRIVYRATLSLQLEDHPPQSA